MCGGGGWVRGEGWGRDEGSGGIWEDMRGSGGALGKRWGGGGVGNPPFFLLPYMEKLKLEVYELDFSGLHYYNIG